MKCLLFLFSESFYGPLHYSRHDAVVLTIMKGRDYGLETYNRVREEIGLGKKSTWEEINNETLKSSEVRMHPVLF